MSIDNDIDLDIDLDNEAKQDLTDKDCQQWMPDELNKPYSCDTLLTCLSSAPLLLSLWTGLLQYLYRLHLLCIGPQEVGRRVHHYARL
jgi:hypothetical protein